MGVPRSLFVASAVGLLTAASMQVSLAATSDVLYAAPNGSGDACSESTPCEPAAALARAESGTVIKLAGGSYGQITARSTPALAAATSPIVVEAQSDGARPVISGISTQAPHVTWRDLKVTDVFMIANGANGTTVQDVHVSGSGMYVRAHDTVVRNSLFEGGSSIDGIQVSRADDIVIENNEIRDYDQAVDNGMHADCIQIFDANNVTVRANRLRDCYGAGLIVSPGSGWGMNNLLIESNFIQGCVEISSSCGGGAAADLREYSARGLTVRNNTFANGSVRIGDLRESSFDRNIIGYMSQCDSPLTNSVIVDWNRRWCPDPAIVTSHGNREGEPVYEDLATGDLFLTDLDSARIAPWGSAQPAPRTIDGQATDPTVAGAALLSSGSASESTPDPDESESTPDPDESTDPDVTQPDTESPKISVAAPANNATVSGSVDLVVKATDNVGVTAVTVWGEGSYHFGDAVVSSTDPDQWLLPVDTTEWANGVYRFTVKATDAAGNTATSPQLKVTVKNSPSKSNEQNGSSGSGGTIRSILDGLLGLFRR